MLLLLETNFLHLILPVAFLLVRVGWPPPLPRTHPFHRGEGGWWVMTMTMAGGVGGGPGTWNIYVCTSLCTHMSIHTYLRINYIRLWQFTIDVLQPLHFQTPLNRAANSSTCSVFKSHFNSICYCETDCNRHEKKPYTCWHGQLAEVFLLLVFHPFDLNILETFKYCFHMSQVKIVATGLQNPVASHLACPISYWCHKGFP